MQQLIFLLFLPKRIIWPFTQLPMHPSKWNFLLCSFLIHLNLPDILISSSVPECFCPVCLPSFLFLPQHMRPEANCWWQANPAVQSSFHGAFGAMTSLGQRAEVGFSLPESTGITRKKTSKPDSLCNAKKKTQPFHPQSVKWLYLNEDEDIFSYFHYICYFGNQCIFSADSCN